MRRERPRRLRRDGIRELVSETNLTTADLIAPLFVDATAAEPTPIPSMPGHNRLPLDEITRKGHELATTGINTVILFGIPNAKDGEGSRAWASDGVIQQAVSRLATETDLTIITDVCLCEYTDHGHCGILEPDAQTSTDTLTVANDATLEVLAKTAVSHADAGADIVAPSSMTDGMVGAIRTALDNADHESIPIMSYAVKYESAFYGPFRDAADGAPTFSDRRHYQMDPANSREAIREAELDEEEGADFLMVKPGMPYLDIVAQLSDSSQLPIVAYQVSGEYAMLVAAAEQGWLDRQATAMESLIGMKRAGADLLITYFAEEIAEVLD